MLSLVPLESFSYALMKCWINPIIKILSKNYTIEFQKKPACLLSQLQLCSLTRSKFRVGNNYEQSIIDHLRMDCLLLNYRKFRFGIHIDGLCENCGVPEDIVHFVADCRNVNSASVGIRRALRLLPSECIPYSLLELVENPVLFKIIVNCLKKKLAPSGQTQRK